MAGGQGWPVMAMGQSAGYDALLDRPPSATPTLVIYMRFDELDFLQQLNEHYAERVQYIPFTWAELEVMLTQLEGANVIMHREGSHGS